MGCGGDGRLICIDGWVRRLPGGGEREAREGRKEGREGKLDVCEFEHYQPQSPPPPPPQRVNSKQTNTHIHAIITSII